MDHTSTSLDRLITIQIKDHFVADVWNFQGHVIRDWFPAYVHIIIDFELKCRELFF